jgi:hypothetical protein
MSQRRNVSPVCPHCGSVRVTGDQISRQERILRELAELANKAWDRAFESRTKVDALLVEVYGKL